MRENEKIYMTEVIVREYSDVETNNVGEVFTSHWLEIWTRAGQMIARTEIKKEQK